MRKIVLILSLCFLSACYKNSIRKLEIQDQSEVETETKVIQEFGKPDISITDDLDRIYREIEETKNGS